MLENLINKVNVDSKNVIPNKPPTIADLKINDEMIILSKKIDDTIAANIKSKEKLFNKADFIENQYLWAIEDLEANLNKKIIKIDATQKNALSKIDPEFITQAHLIRKNADLDFVKAKNKVLIDRINHSDSKEEIKKAKIEQLKKGQDLEFEEMEKGYQNVIKHAWVAQNLKKSKKIRTEHDKNVVELRKEFENSKKELMKLHNSSIEIRKQEVDNLRKQYKPTLLSSENVTDVQAAIYLEFINSQKKSKLSANNFQKEINILSKNKSRAQIKIVNKAEIENNKFEDLKITRTKPVSKEMVANLKKERLLSINEGIKNNINSFKENVDQKMLKDLVPSYHTYWINPLILPNNTYKAHKRQGLYKGIKYTLPLIGVVIGIFLMVLYSLFSFQATLLWIDTGIQSFGTDSANALIFQSNATIGFAELYRIWGLDNDAIWNTVLAFGILILILSATTITIRNNTLWSYISIISIFVFLIIGFGLMLSIMINMGFGDTSVDGTLNMLVFRQIIGAVETAGPITATTPNPPTYIELFNKLIISLGGSWEPIEHLSPTMLIN